MIKFLKRSWLFIQDRVSPKWKQIGDKVVRLDVRVFTMFEEWEWKSQLCWVYLEQSRAGRLRTRVVTPYLSDYRPAVYFDAMKDLRD